MSKQPPPTIYLSLAAQRTLLQDIQTRPQIEACGMLLGRSEPGIAWQIEEALPLRNIYNSPVYFEFAPEDILSADLNYPGRVVGVYHSHPTGFAKASDTDRQNMQRVNGDEQIPWCWLIISGPFNGLAEKAKATSEALIFAGLDKIAYHHDQALGLKKLSITLEEQK